MSRFVYFVAITLMFGAPFLLTPLLIAAAGPTAFFFALGVASTVLMAVAWLLISPSWPAIGMRVRSIAAIAIALEIAAVAFWRAASYASAHSGPAVALAALVFSWMLCRAWIIKRPPEPLNLRSPFNEGLYALAHGGNTAVLNNHHRHERQRYAIDVVRLAGPLLSKCNRIVSACCEDYAIYGTPIVAPCSGKVVGVRDGLEDLRPGSMDARNAFGNYVALQTEDGTHVVLCHLQKGSVSVTAEQTVNEGDALGRVGNSGNTTEPHLHLHAERAGHAIPITINGRRLFRNTIFEGAAK